jgi:hypothetical protein
LFINLPAARTLSIPIPSDSNVMQQRLERQKQSVFLHDEYDLMRSQQQQQQGQEHDPSDQP